MSKVRCFKCNGKGVIYDIDPFLGLVTLGMVTLMQLGDPDECDACNGKGYLEDE